MDVNVANFGIKRIIVYEGDTVESLVADFVKKCPIDEFMIDKLKLLLQQQMDGVLERIDEDEEQKTDQSVETGEGEEYEGANEMHKGSSLGSGKKEDNEDGGMLEHSEQQQIALATQETIGDGLTAPQHIVDEADSLAQTVVAHVEQELMEGAAQVQPFRESTDESPKSQLQ